MFRARLLDEDAVCPVVGIGGVHVQENPIPGNVRFCARRVLAAPPADIDEVFLGQDIGFVEVGPGRFVAAHDRLGPVAGQGVKFDPDIDDITFFRFNLETMGIGRFPAPRAEILGHPAVPGRDRRLSEVSVGVTDDDPFGVADTVVVGWGLVAGP